MLVLLCCSNHPFAIGRDRPGTQVDGAYATPSWDLILGLFPLCGILLRTRGSCSQLGRTEYPSGLQYGLQQHASGSLKTLLMVGHVDEELACTYLKY